MEGKRNLSTVELQFYDMMRGQQNHIVRDIVGNELPNSRTPELPRRVTARHSEILNCPVLFISLMALKRVQAKYTIIAFNSE